MLYRLSQTLSPNTPQYRVKRVGRSFSESKEIGSWFLYSNIVLMLTILVHLLAFLENLKTTKFTVRFQILAYAKWVAFANTYCSDDVCCKDIKASAFRKDMLSALH